MGREQEMQNRGENSKNDKRFQYSVLTVDK